MIKIIGLTLFFWVLILLGLYIFFDRIYSNFKHKARVIQFDELFSILKTVINSELQAYENDVFVVKKAITTANFENYYLDLSKKIFHSLSPNFYVQMTAYLTRDQIYLVICRAVKTYLTDKGDTSHLFTE